MALRWILGFSFIAMAAWTLMPDRFENGDPAYAADHVRVLAHWMRDTPLNPSNLRAPGKPANVFAVEGFTDEIAAALKVDPLGLADVARHRVTASKLIDKVGFDN